MRMTLATVLLAAVAPGAAAQSLVLKANMDVLRCGLPAAGARLAGGSAPGLIFLPAEPVNLRLVLQKQEPADAALEIQEITTRDPEKHIRDGAAYTDTAGFAPLIGLE